MLLPPPLDNLCSILFVFQIYHPMTIPCHLAFHLLPCALVYPLRARILFNVACVYPFFLPTYIMEDLAADLNCLFLFTFVHAMSPQYNMLAFLCESLDSENQSKIDKEVELYEPLDCDSFSISSCDNPSRRLSR